MTPDTELLKDYAANKSERAFATFVRRHAGLVYAAALRQLNGDTHLAEDVAQVVFTEVARRSAVIADHPRLVGWLYSTTHFAAAKAVRTERRRRDREQAVHHLDTMNAASESSPPLDWNRLGPVLDAALLELEAIDREAVLLRFFSNRTFSEVGEALQLTEEAARKRVARALEKINAVLAARGLPSTSAALALALADPAAVAVPSAVVTTLTFSPVGAGAASLFIMSTSKSLLTVAVVTILAGGIVVYRSRTTPASVDTPALVRPGTDATVPTSPSHSPTPAPIEAAGSLPAAPVVAAIPLIDPEQGLTEIAAFGNRGRSTPSAGFQTAIWAATKGDNAVLDESFQLVASSRAKLDATWAAITDAERASIGRPERILSLFFAEDLLGGLVRVHILQTLDRVEPGDTAMIKQYEALVDLLGGPAAASGRLALIKARAELLPRNEGEPNRVNERIFPMWLDGSDWKIIVPDSLVPTVARIRAGKR